VANFTENALGTGAISTFALENAGFGPSALSRLSPPQMLILPGASGISSMIVLQISQ